MVALNELCPLVTLSRPPRPLASPQGHIRPSPSPSAHSYPSEGGMCGYRRPGDPEPRASPVSPRPGRKLLRGSAGRRRPAWIPRPGQRRTGRATRGHLCVCPAGSEARTPTATPVARVPGRPSPRSRSPAATAAEGPAHWNSRPWV